MPSYMHICRPTHTYMPCGVYLYVEPWEAGGAWPLDKLGHVRYQEVHHLYLIAFSILGIKILTKGYLAGRYAISGINGYVILSIKGLI